MLIVSLYEVRYDLLDGSFLQIEIRDHPGIICMQIGQFLFAEILQQRFGQPAIFLVHRFQQLFPFRGELEQNDAANSLAQPKQGTANKKRLPFFRKLWYDIPRSLKTHFAPITM